MISSLCCLPLSLFALPRSTDPSRAVFMWAIDPKVNRYTHRGTEIASRSASPRVPRPPLPPRAAAQPGGPLGVDGLARRNPFSRVMGKPGASLIGHRLSASRPTRLDAIMVLAALCFLFCLRRQCRPSSHRLLPQQHTCHISQIHHSA